MAIRLYSNAQEEQVTQNGLKTLIHKQGETKKMVVYRHNFWKFTKWGIIGFNMNAREAILFICQAQLSRAGTSPFASVSIRDTYRDWTHTKRGEPSIASCPACWAMGTKVLKKCMVRKKIFCTGPTRAAKTEQKALVPAWQQGQRTNQVRTSFICTLWVPILLSFNSHSIQWPADLWFNLELFKVSRQQVVYTYLKIR